MLTPLIHIYGIPAATAPLQRSSSAPGGQYSSCPAAQRFPHLPRFSMKRSSLQAKVTEPHRVQDAAAKFGKGKKENIGDLTPKCP